MNAKLFSVIFIFIGALSCAANIEISPASPALTGPKLKLDYTHQAEASNPVACFMYFIPLTSPASVTVATDPGTTFSAGITSWKTTQKDGTVHVQCNFKVTGQGSYRAFYDPEEMIRNQLSRRKKNVREVTTLLEWIRLEGPCLGRIDGFGKIVNDRIQMDCVEISFTRDNTQSPVHVGIYDIPHKNGQFLFENRRNCQIARINSLTFKRENDGTPRMSVEIASLKKAEKKEGIISHVTATLANILSTSTPVAPIGNTTMMNFGAVLYEKKPSFTFPCASNIRTTQISKL